MKKIILLLACLFLCGCYDYKELNQIAIIGGIGIDYNEEYIVSLEIINDKKTSEGDSDTIKTAVITGRGKGFVDAFNDAIIKVDRDPYFYQMQVLLLSEEAATKGISEIFDYLLRESKINNSFYTLVTKDIKPQDILEVNSITEPVASTKIIKLLQDSSSDIKFKKDDEFDLLVSTYVKDGIDIALASLEMDDKEIAINHIAGFKGDRLQGFLRQSDSITYSLLTNKSDGIQLHSGGNVVSIYGNKLKKEFKDGKVILTFTADATIALVDEQVNFRDEEIYNKLSEEFSQVMEKDIKELIKNTRSIESDILGLGRVIYLDNPNVYEDDIGLNVEVEVKAEINVNKNGITFEVIR